MCDMPALSLERLSILTLPHYQMLYRPVCRQWSGIRVAGWSQSMKLTYVRPGLYWDGWLITVSGFNSGAAHLSRYVTSHPGQLILAIPSWVGAVSTSQGTVRPYGWAVKAGMVRVWVAGKTVWSSCYTWAITEHSRDKGLIIKCYIIHLFSLLYFASSSGVVSNRETLLL